MKKRVGNEGGLWKRGKGMAWVRNLVTRNVHQKVYMLIMCVYVTVLSISYPLSIGIKTTKGLL